MVRDGLGPPVEDRAVPVDTDDVPGVRSLAMPAGLDQLVLSLFRLLGVLHQFVPNFRRPGRAVLADACFSWNPGLAPVAGSGGRRLLEKRGDSLFLYVVQ